MYINKVLCFYNMYIISIASDAQPWEFFINHLQSNDAAEIHHGEHNLG